MTFVCNLSDQKELKFKEVEDNVKSTQTTTKKRGKPCDIINPSIVCGDDTCEKCNIIFLHYKRIKAIILWILQK